MQDETPKYPIWYEPHPVSMERKAELRAKGFRILDAVFMPEGHVNPGTEEEPKGQATHRGRAEGAIKAQLDAAGISHHHNAGLKKLQELLPQA